MATSAVAIRNPVYGEDESDVLISKATWTLKLSGLVFAGLLVIGRSASYGNVTWTPTFHPADAPLIVLSTSHGSPLPAPTKYKGVDSAAISKRSAAAEVVVFNPGSSGDGEDNRQGDQNGGTAGHVDKNHPDDHDSDVTGSGNTAAGSGHGSGAGTVAQASSTSAAQGSGNGSGAATAGNASRTSAAAQGSGH